MLEAAWTTQVPVAYLVLPAILSVSLALWVVPWRVERLVDRALPRVGAQLVDAMLPRVEAGLTDRLIPSVSRALQEAAGSTVDATLARAETGMGEVLARTEAAIKGRLGGLASGASRADKAMDLAIADQSIAALVGDVGLEAIREDYPWIYQAIRRNPAAAGKLVEKAAGKFPQLRKLLED